ncbi:Uncharacterized lipoprotein YehR, DUF1307 family [Pilibacter termitis]|uniref:Uncharacterized lipoprotein YehR, DUF1307 family n=1 Tax=Pilibacter termitis TaxID=263852 RepID=A0A1T4QF24_9ENTE|nr:DUF1307 domain-containing protein [Pilibacter termitis]SKA02403.1 Uncharacterized lipoprotein YehR, DUF1307 family [Pilibacter termitis]
MKKIYSVIFTLALSLIVLVGCGEEKGQKTFTQEKNGVSLSVTYYYTGDNVTKQTTKSSMPYSSLNAKTKEEAKKIADPLSEQYQGVKGLSEKLSYGKDTLTETIEVDYTKVDFDELSKIPSMILDENVKKTKKISMKKSEELLEKQGFKEKK